MEKRRRFRGLPVLLAVLLFAGLAALPWLYNANGTPPWVAHVKSQSPVPLPKAPSQLRPVALPAVAQPVDPGGPIAKLPSGDGTFLPTLISSEANRLNIMLGDSIHMTAPGVIDSAGSVATLVLPGRTTPYTFADLLTYGAVIPWNQPGTYLLLDSVFVAPSANLQIGGDGLSTLLMDTSPSRFTSIVTWEGTIAITGTATSPIKITGWNNGPATNPNFGRPYLRAIGGNLELSYVHASSLGFWSGLTGGVSWTSTAYRPATGGAIASQFMGDTYGAFVDGAVNVQFTDDLFESNQVDGLRLHRNADNSTVTDSASVRNGANGFVVSRGNHDVLSGDVALHNGSNGFLINAQPLVSGASPTGGSNLPASGLVVKGGEAEGNEGTGILLEGGQGTVLQDNIVCGSAVAVAIRLGATNTSVVGNNVRCGRNIDLSVGPGVTNTVISDNTMSNSAIGIMLLSSPATHLLNNHMTGLSVFGLSVRGTSPGSAGSGNVIAGKGFAPIEIQAGTKAPSMAKTNVTGWDRRSSLTVPRYLIYHPLLLAWLIILCVVTFFCIVTRLRRRPFRPYAHVLPWYPASSGGGRGASAEVKGRPTTSAAAGEGPNDALPWRPAFPDGGRETASEVTRRQPVSSATGELATSGDLAPEAESQSVDALPAGGGRGLAAGWGESK